jgi:hypothetical protein
MLGAPAEPLPLPLLLDFEPPPPLDDGAPPAPGACMPALPLPEGAALLPLPPACAPAAPPLAGELLVVPAPPPEAAGLPPPALFDLAGEQPANAAADTDIARTNRADNHLIETSTVPPVASHPYAV